MSRPKPTSIENGNHSHGPVTAEGKRRASMNRVRHGICSATHVILPGEDPAQFEKLAAAYAQQLQPNSALEEDLVHDLVTARWRLRRINLIETTLMDGAMGDQLGDDPIQKMAESFAALAEDRALSLLLRYRTSTERTIQRCINDLIKVKKQLPDTTAPERFYDEVLAQLDARCDAPASNPEPVDLPKPQPKPPAPPKLPNEPIFITPIRIPAVMTATQSEMAPPNSCTA